MEATLPHPMSIWNELRSLVFLRRIARAQERLADVAEIRLAHDRLKWRDGKRPAVTEFGSFDIAEANSRWAKEQEAKEFGVEIEP